MGGAGETGWEVRAALGHRQTDPNVERPGGIFEGTMRCMHIRSEQAVSEKLPPGGGPGRLPGGFQAAPGGRGVTGGGTGITHQIR